MATTKIRGITIEIGADTDPIVNAFKTTTKSISETEKSLKDVEKLLKLDPQNVTLLSQKQDYLNKVIAETRQSLKLQEEMLKQIPTDTTGKLSEEQMALMRNIEATKAKLDGYNTSLTDTQNKLLGVADETQKTGDEFIEAGNKANTFADVLKANLTADALKSLGTALVDAGKKLWDMGVASASYADEVLQLSTQFGIGTDTLQEYMYMAELTDTSVETITGSITKLTKNMQSASEGSKTTSKAFKTLGVEVTNSDGTMRDANDVFNDTIKALGGVENETERNALAMTIFGKSAMDLNPLIAVGADGLAQYAEEAHNVGYVLDTETLEALGETDDQMQRAKKALEAVTTQIGTYLAPVVATIAEKFADWMATVDWKKVAEVAGTALEKIGKAIGWVIDKVSSLIDWIRKAIQWVKDLFNGEIKLPKIKLPHISLTPKGWKIGDLLKGSIPKIGIEWYAKGMEGMVLDGPTIFGMNKNGQLMAGGEAGREIIIGESNLKRALAGAGTTSINIVVNEASSPRATAMEVSNEIQRQMNAYGRAWR